jgi:hypothetical protein
MGSGEPAAGSTTIGSSGNALDTSAPFGKGRKNPDIIFPLAIRAKNLFFPGIPDNLFKSFGTIQTAIFVNRHLTLQQYYLVVRPFGWVATIYIVA